jgi:hypothetical protein
LWPIERGTNRNLPRDTEEDNEISQPWIATEIQKYASLKSYRVGNASDRLSQLLQYIAIIIIIIIIIIINSSITLPP